MEGSGACILKDVLQGALEMNQVRGLHPRGCSSGCPGDGWGQGPASYRMSFREPWRWTGSGACILEDVLQGALEMDRVWGLHLRHSTAGSESVLISWMSLSIVQLSHAESLQLAGTVCQLGFWGLGTNH